MKRHIKNNVWWVGKIDWELKTFHGYEYSTHKGSSYNSYLIQEEKTVLIDTVWQPFAKEFVKNLSEEIDLTKIDYIIANHAEIDHSGALPELMKHIPDTPIYCTANAVKSIEGQYGKNNWDLRVVKTGDSVDIGNGKKLIFVEMTMLHWPDSMATYMTGDAILFSNDAFGQHYAVGGLFNDTADQCKLEYEAMKYYANILAPFSTLVSKKITEIKSLNLPIDMIATSHGAIWRDKPMWIIEKYAEWAEEYQEDQLTILYDSMWEGTAAIAREISRVAARVSPNTMIRMFNCSKSDLSEMMTEVFKSKAIAVGSPTISRDIMMGVSSTIRFMKSLKFKNKRAAAFGCYGWSGESVDILKRELADAGFQVTDTNIRSMWKPNDEDLESAEELVRALLG